MRSAVAGAGERQIILDGVTGWSLLTGGTNGLNIATRGATDRTYVFFRENAQAASASPARISQNFVTGSGGDWDITKFQFSAPTYVPSGTSVLPGYSWYSESGSGWYRRAAENFHHSINGTDYFALAGGKVKLGSGTTLEWSAGAAIGANGSDLFLFRDGAANTLAQKNGNADQLDRLYAMNSGYWEKGSASELLNLSTSGTTTDTTANLLPANSIIEAVTARVTTTITTATSWQLGDPTTAGRFTAANATMTAGTTDVGLVHIDVAGAGGPRQTAAAKVRVTTVGTPGAGVVRITVYFRRFVPPTS